MSLYKGCPGAIRFREAVPEYLDCPQCGEEMEIWSDELVARCHHCQALVRRDQEPSCIDWCQYAEECIGVEAYKRLRYPPESSGPGIFNPGKSPSEGKGPEEKA